MTTAIRREAAGATATIRRESPRRLRLDRPNQTPPPPSFPHTTAAVSRVSKSGETRGCGDHWIIFFSEIIFNNNYLNKFSFKIFTKIKRGRHSKWRPRATMASPRVVEATVAKWSPFQMATARSPLLMATGTPPIFCFLLILASSSFILTQHIFIHHSSYFTSFLLPTHSNNITYTTYTTLHI